MPAFLTKGKTQHTTEEANESRLCTKNLRIVKSYHARIKKWRLLAKTVQNSFIPSLNDCVRIISAALNHFRGPIISYIIPMKKNRGKKTKIKGSFHRVLK